MYINSIRSMLNTNRVFVLVRACASCHVFFYILHCIRLKVYTCDVKLILLLVAYINYTLTLKKICALLSLSILLNPYTMGTVIKKQLPCNWNLNFTYVGIIVRNKITKKIIGIDCDVSGATPRTTIGEVLINAIAP